MDSKKLFKFLTAGALALSTLAGCGGSGNNDETVKIGLIYELSGAVAEYGKAELKGSQLAIELANKELGTEKYKGIEYDTTSDTGKATSLAEQAVDEGVIGIVGPATSGASKAIYPVANDGEVPVISPSATEIDVTKDPSGKVYDYIYRVCFEDSYQGAAMAQFAVDTLKAGKVAIYGEDSQYGNGLADSFEKQFTKLGGTIVFKGKYNAGDKDFDGVLTPLVSQGIDVLYIPGYYAEAGLIIRKARELGINCAIIGADGFDSPTLPDIADAKNLNNVYYTTAYTTVGASDALLKFVDDYKAKFNEEPSMFAALAFDSTNLLIQAIEEAGTTDTAAVKAALDKIEFNGITGSFTFDDAHTPVKSVLVVELVDGVQEDAVNVTPKN